MDTQNTLNRSNTNYFLVSGRILHACTRNKIKVVIGKKGKHQWLEKAHEPGASDEELVLDLYCPIVE